MKTKKKQFIEDYKMECKSGLKLFAFIVATWVLFGVILVLLFL